MADIVAISQARANARRYRDEVRSYNDYINGQIDDSLLRQDVLQQTSEQEQARIIEEALAKKGTGSIYGFIQAGSARQDWKEIKEGLERTRQERAVALEQARAELGPPREATISEALAEEGSEARRSVALAGDAHEAAVGRRAKAIQKEIKAMSNEEKIAAGLKYAKEAKDAGEVMKEASLTQKLMKGAVGKAGSAANVAFGGIALYQDIEDSVKAGDITIEGENDWQKWSNGLQVAAGVADGIGLFGAQPEFLLAGALLGGASAVVGEVGTFVAEDEEAKAEKEATAKKVAQEKKTEAEEREKLIDVTKANIPIGGATVRIEA